MALVSNDGWAALLRDAAIRWSVCGTETNYHGDISVEKATNKGGLFSIRCFGSRVDWEGQADGSELKVVDDNLFDICIGLPTDSKEMRKVMQRKVRGRNTKAVCHRIHFPPNEGGLDYIQVTVQVFGADTKPSDYFDAALNYAKLETFADTVEKGKALYKKHEEHCECRLCIRQALRSNQQH